MAKITQKAPSNIALVKYWGKREGQLPANPSVSFTLTNCYTETSVTYTPEHTASFEFFFEGEAKPLFHPKLTTFFERIADLVPFIKEYHLRIDSHNSFPHSSGIASSASAMAALALCLVRMEQQLGTPMTEEEALQKASVLARLGSGSACRSVYSGLVVWGAHKSIAGSSDDYGIPYPLTVNEVFKNYQDSILLIDKGRKQVSSSVGHNLMHGHPFAQARFAQAHQHIEELIPVFAAGDLERFIAIIESEALTLHAMMQTSQPYFILMRPNTLEAINRIWAFRQETKTPVGFTLDAGANVHLLYPAFCKEAVQAFITAELKELCEGGQVIADAVKG